VAPLLKKPVKFTLVGSNPPYIVRTMARHGDHAGLFKVTGYVPDTFPYLNRAKISIAPILFGAGMNGKIGEAMAAGVPVITTALGALGMGLTHEENCLVAEGPQEFADAIDRLHNDEALWKKLQTNGRSFLEENLASEGMEEAICQSVLGDLDLKRIRGLQDAAWLKKVAPPAPVELGKAKFRTEKKPDISVILLAFNQWKVTELCLRSLAHAQKSSGAPKAEIILVDNASSDETVREAKKIPGLRVIANKKNHGFAAGNNIGIKAARGRDIVLLNNDTVVPPHWLERLALHASRIPDLGILGPSTNTETNQVLPGAQYHSVPEFFSFNREVEAKHRGQWQMVRKISGLCMYLPRHTIEKVGLLDESYGIGYFEDDDYCLRTANAGLKIVWAKDLYLHHFGSMSFEGNSMKRDKYLEFGMSQFIFKWGKRGLDHIAKAHDETLLRPRRPSHYEIL
jgi:GT2 family glycosyltransferase